MHCKSLIVVFCVLLSEEGNLLNGTNSNYHHIYIPRALVYVLFILCIPQPGSIKMNTPGRVKDYAKDRLTLVQCWELFFTPTLLLKILEQTNTGIQKLIDRLNSIPRVLNLL